MERAQDGSTVCIHYIGTLDNGRIFHSTTEEEPLIFTIGRQQVFPLLEQAVLGMQVGQTRNVVIPAAEAYGPRLEEHIIRVGRGQFPAGRELKVGQKLAIDFSGGESRVMLVREVNETEVTLDGNHPLAGLDLTFALRLDRIQ